MSWDLQMGDTVQQSVVAQLSAAFNFNKTSSKCLPMVFTSVQQRWQELLHRSNCLQWSKAIATFKKEPFLKAISASDLVYLVPGSPNICTTLDPAKAYVIGCLLGENSTKDLIPEFAQSHGIRTERLPIQEHAPGLPGLTIDGISGILVRVSNGLDWGEAISLARESSGAGEESSWCYRV